MIKINLKHFIILMKRLFDLTLSFILIIIFIFPMIVIYLLIISTSKGEGIYFSIRVGKNNNEFLMPKFRTMKKFTPQVATHQISDPKKYITSVGRILRKTSLDELPQSFSVLHGKMSLVGPRPALYNQYDLIKLRQENKIDDLKPGITGYAQINGRDTLSIKEKVKYDKEYRKNISFLLDIKIIIKTIFQIFSLKHIQH